MSNNRQDLASWGSWGPWAWIAFLLILVWPLGVYFLFKKLSADKTATLKNAKIFTVISYILIGVGVFCLLWAVSGDLDKYSAAVLFGGGGSLVYYFAKKMQKEGDKQQKYFAIVIGQSQTSVDYIASAMGVPYETAVNDLRDMIDAGYFADSYINETSRTIVHPHTVTQTEH